MRSFDYWFWVALVFVFTLNLLLTGLNVVDEFSKTWGITWVVLSLLGWEIIRMKESLVQVSTLLSVWIEKEKEDYEASQSDKEVKQ